MKDYRKLSQNELIQRLKTREAADALVARRKQAPPEVRTGAAPLARAGGNPESAAAISLALHDLRSPLVNIQGFSDELIRSFDQLRRHLEQDSVGKRAGANGLRSHLREIAESLNYIQAAVSKMDALLLGLSEYARLGRVAPKFEPLNMSVLVAGVVQGMQFQVKQAGARLQSGKLPACEGDPAQISQVFSNLLDNALKYLAPERPGRITVTGKRRKGCSIYCVRDNGIGIAPEHQTRVFELCQRLATSQCEGEGLGLAIARRIVEQHRGQIRVESKPGAGAAFFVSLPAPAKAK